MDLSENRVRNIWLVLVVDHIYVHWNGHDLRHPTHFQSISGSTKIRRLSRLYLKTAREELVSASHGRTLCMMKVSPWPNNGESCAIDSNSQAPSLMKPLSLIEILYIYMLYTYINLYIYTHIDVCFLYTYIFIYLYVCFLFTKSYPDRLVSYFTPVLLSRPPMFSPRFFIDQMYPSPHVDYLYPMNIPVVMKSTMFNVPSYTVPTLSQGACPPQK